LAQALAQAPAAIYPVLDRGRVGHVSAKLGTTREERRHSALP